MKAKEYKKGFTYSTLSKNIKKQISGKSFRKNKYIGYSELRYLHVKYFNFHGKVCVGEIIVNKKIAKRTLQVFYGLYKMKYPIEKIRLVDQYGGDDNKSMAANNSSAFNFRKVQNSSKLSDHARGLAIDINPRINPYIVKGKIYPKNGSVYKNRNKKTCKGKCRKLMIKRGDKVYRLFKKYGFSWGGDWTTVKDYQHFYYKG